MYAYMYTYMYIYICMCRERETRGWRGGAHFADVAGALDEGKGHARLAHVEEHRTDARVCQRRLFPRGHTHVLSLHELTYICIYVYIYINIYMCICIYTYSRVDTYICIYTYTHIHIYEYMYEDVHIDRYKVDAP